ncbi:hypothetical protein [Burkholderia cepacia]|uniref:hypothetical protein n=1 Tax=Burkholderia cepacia TaxID=292 RepID=UPI001CF368A3|nr:hypothetical protein [Burkholderia cepacia]MCA8116935.1 hypothetical protein [Burkholderia cepacia]MCA8403094.1 hypothetical protein [Burkholderia cepacia]
MPSLTSIAHALRVQSHANATPIILGHAQQLIAAALGYNAFAAYQASPDDSNLEGARHFVLDLGRVHQRAHELGVSVSAAQLDALLGSVFADQLPKARFHRSDSALEDYIRDRLDHLVTNDGEAVGQMELANHDGIGEVYLPFDLALANLPPPGETNEIEVLGHIGMNQDLERPYSGHVIDIEASVSVERTGRVSIAEPDITVLQAKLNYDW